MKGLLIFGCVILTAFAATTTNKPGIKSREISRTVRIQLSHPKGDVNDVCAGTILTPRWILTTAHNLDDVAGKQLRVVYETDPDKYKLHTFSSKSLTETTMLHKIKNQFVHPKWVKGTQILPAENNIALLELEEPLKVPKGFEQYYLPPLTATPNPSNNKLPKTVNQMSFFTDFASTPEDKKKTFTDFPCKNHPLNPTVLTEKVCGHVCNTLTGTALFELKDRVNNVDILFGIVQVEVLPCNKAPISFYTSVQPFVQDFIQKIIPKNETLKIIPA